MNRIETNVFAIDINTLETSARSLSLSFPLFLSLPPSHSHPQSRAGSVEVTYEVVPGQHYTGGAITVADMMALL